MKKYFAFLIVGLKAQLKTIINSFSTIFSFIIHITMFSFLWDFVLDGKDIQGYSKEQLIWYVIMAEVITYSFGYYYKKIAYKVEMGDFGYDMSKPYNFLGRCFMEGFSELPITFILLGVGGIMGTFLAGPLKITFIGILQVILVTTIAVINLLGLNIIVGMLTIWVGKDVSSIWLLIGKAMLIFAFSPLELFPKWAQLPLILIPTTNIIYTPSKLLVHTSNALFVKSLVLEAISFVIIGIVLTIVYMKGVKKQNVYGI